MRSWAGVALTVGAGVLLFLIGLDGGGYGLAGRATIAIVVWWTLLMAVILGLWPLVTPPRAAYVVGGLLVAFAAVTAASLLWTESPERTFTELNRVLLYVGVFLVAVCAATRGNLGRWLDGLALGITAVGVLALASRCFPDVLPSGDVPDFLPSAFARLSYPVEYWNGLGILVGLGLPLLLRAAAQPRHAVWRGLAVAPFPALAAVLYFTSSRGGFATALVTVGSLLVLTPRRWPTGAAAGVAGLGAAAAIAFVERHDALGNDPFSDAAVGQGRNAAFVILALCLAVAFVYGLGTLLVPSTLRIPRALGWATAALVAAGVLAGAAAADPVQRFESFKDPPTAFAEEDFVQAHLLSGNGSGRWQFWDSALEQWEAEPVAGQGAGSYESWWAENGKLAMFIRDAHSLYLETLGELGMIGFLLLVGAFASGVVVGLRRLLAAEGDERAAIAAVLATFLGYVVAVGIDWMWELTIVSVVGIAALGFLTGPASAASGRPRLLTDPEPGERRSRRRFAVGVAAVSVGWLVICAQAIPFLADVKISDSQAAARRGDAEQALEDARAAQNIQPWAASPYLQVALVEEALGRLDPAEAAILDAIDRDPRDWRLWLVASRVQTKAGDVAAARESLRRAAALNPRSPLFASVA